MPKPIMIYTTFPSIEKAREITSVIISEKLVACANILPGMEACYEWQGKIETAQEVVTLLKTTESQEAQLMDRLAELHPYETPCMLTLEVKNGYMPYISWLFAALNK